MACLSGSFETNGSAPALKAAEVLTFAPFCASPLWEPLLDPRLSQTALHEHRGKLHLCYLSIAAEPSKRLESAVDPALS